LWRFTNKTICGGSKVGSTSYLHCPQASIHGVVHPWLGFEYALASKEEEKIGQVKQPCARTKPKWLILIQTPPPEIKLVPLIQASSHHPLTWNGSTI